MKGQAKCARTRAQQHPSTKFYGLSNQHVNTALAPYKYRRMLPFESATMGTNRDSEGLSRIDQTKKLFTRPESRGFWGEENYAGLIAATTAHAAASFILFGGRGAGFGQ